MSQESVAAVRRRLHTDPAFREAVRSAPAVALADYDLTADERLSFVLLNFSWLVPGKLAGMARPRSTEAFVALPAAGIRALLTLTEAPLPPEALAAAGLEAAHVPMADFSAPNVAQATAAVGAIDGFLARGLPVAVHCAAGMGRTGTILACYLTALGRSPQEAILTVRAARPGSIETVAQEEAVHRFAVAWPTPPG